MIIVCSLRAAPQCVVDNGAQGVIGILGPETAHPTFESLAPGRHLKLAFNDINVATPGMTAATSQDVARLLDYLRAWDRKAPLVIHCWAGISRSTATAFAALCLLRPDASELALARELRAASPSATPNRLITSLVDEALGRQGRMVKAVEAIGRGAEAFEGGPFRVAV